jgi:hypothetical protein
MSGKLITYFYHPDVATIRSWRSETLNAIANKPNFETYLASCVNDLTERLREMLGIFVPRADMEKFQSSIQAQIINPAVGLAHKLHLSTDLYKVRWTRYAEAHSGEELRSMSDPEQYECENHADDGRIIKFPADQQRSGREYVTYILDIFPGLYCYNVKSDGYSEPKVLKRPKILAAMPALDKPPFQLWTPAGEEATLLGSMSKQLQQKREVG